MDHVQQLHDGGAVVADGGLAVLRDDQLVHAAGPQGGAHRVHDGTAGIDV